jgi:hypothetical protein
MMEKLKGIVELFDFLGQYPHWLKIGLLLWVFFSGGLLCAMVVLYPKKVPVTILRVTLIKDAGQGIGFQIRVQNSTDVQAELVALEMEFYESEPSPEDGALQSTESVTGHYTILKNPETGELATKLNNESALLPATISFPIQGRTDYALLTLELAQKIKGKGSDRFEVAIRAPDFPPKEAKYLRTVIQYDDGKRTPAKVQPLQ